MPLFTAHYYKDQFQLPDMKTVYIAKPRELFQFDFHQAMLNLTVQKDTTVYFEGDNPWHDLAPEDHTICFKDAVLLGVNHCACTKCRRGVGCASWAHVPRCPLQMCFRTKSRRWRSATTRGKRTTLRCQRSQGRRRPTSCCWTAPVKRPGTLATWTRC